MELMICCKHGGRAETYPSRAEPSPKLTLYEPSRTDSEIVFLLVEPEAAKQQQLLPHFRHSLTRVAKFRVPHSPSFLSLRIIIQKFSASALRFQCVLSYTVVSFYSAFRKF